MTPVEATPQFLKFMDRCQVAAAGHGSEVAVLMPLLTEAHQFITEPEQSIVKGVLMAFALRLRSGMDRDAFVRLLDRVQHSAPEDGASPIAFSGPWRHRELARRIIRTIDQRVEDPGLAVETVARDLRRSPDHLGGILRRTTGRSFRTLLSERRVRRAQDLLRDPTLTVKEAAAMVGFTSVSEMDRHFRRRLGTTPSAFRESLG